MSKSETSLEGRKSLGEIPGLLNKMEGLTVALATPLDEHGDPDIGAMERLIERVIEGGATCLFPLGWAGEGPLLTHGARELVMRETCAIAGGRLPVMVGISEQSLPRTLELAAMARRAGADAILATPPYSYPIPQHLVFDYFKDLASSSEMPLVVYQNDEVGVRVEVETLVRLSETPWVVGVKAFVPFVELQQSFHRAHKPGRFAVMSGNEYFYGAALLLGIRHFTMGGPGNLCPKWCMSIYHSALEGDWDAVTSKQRRLTDFCDAIYSAADTAYVAFKCALEYLGVCSARITSPHGVVTAEQRRKIDAALKDFADILD